MIATVARPHRPVPHAIDSKRKKGGPRSRLNGGGLPVARELNASNTSVLNWLRAHLCFDALGVQDVREIVEE